VQRFNPPSLAIVYALGGINISLAISSPHCRSSMYAAHSAYFYKHHKQPYYRGQLG